MFGMTNEDLVAEFMKRITADDHDDFIRYEMAEIANDDSWDNHKAFQMIIELALR